LWFAENLLLMKVNKSLQCDNREHEWQGKPPTGGEPGVGSRVREEPGVAGVAGEAGIVRNHPLLPRDAPTVVVDQQGRVLVPCWTDG